MTVRACLLAGMVALTAAHAADPAPHPRLFFGPEEVPVFRERAGREPWKDMLETARLAARVKTEAQEWIPRAQIPAALWLFTGDPKEADSARDHVLGILSLPKFWSSSSLERGTAAGQIAVAFDLCHAAWKGQKVPESVRLPFHNEPIPVKPEWVGKDLNSVISTALRDLGDSLIADGGEGWPGHWQYGNNWYAVRYAGAGLAYLATDDAVDPAKFREAVEKLTKYFRMNLGGGPESQGWNVEGIGYLLFPGQTSMPFVLALRRNANAALGGEFVRRDLAADVPAVGRTLFTIYPGAIAQTHRHPYREDFSGIGLRPDFNDDHPALNGAEGCAALAFALCPPERFPGMKWMFRRFWGDLGDRTWDSTAGQPLWALLFYPAELEEKNPADVWGLTWHDPAMGMFVLRNRYRDVEDSVFQANASLRATEGGHGGPDDLTFRFWSLGVPWVVGSGRNYDNPFAGQSTLFPAEPESLESKYRVPTSRIVSTELPSEGGGSLVLAAESLSTGVRDITRRFVVRYDIPGTEAAVVAADTSTNARIWRLNTPDFNRITTDDARRMFTFTSPDGHRLTGHVLWPGTVRFRQNTEPYDRTHVRFPYKDIGWTPEGYKTGNRWLDFETPDGRAVVVLTVTRSGADPVPVEAPAGWPDHVRIGSTEVKLP